MSNAFFRPRSLLERWLGSKVDRRRSPDRRPLRRFESLESRELLTITPGAETRVNNVVNDAQQTFFESNRTVAMNSDGRSVVVWSSFNQDSTGTWGVYSQIYNANGGLVGGGNLVNQTILNDQRFPTVAIADDGSYVITWTSNQASADGSFDVYARRFNSTGTALTPEFRVNTTVTGDQQYSRIAMANDGTFVITWSSGAIDSTTRDVFFQRYSATGAPLGNETRANSTTTNDQSFSSVAVAEDNSFVITWSSNQTGGNYDIYFRRFSASGAQLSAETRINDTIAGNQTNSDIVVDATGAYTVTWTSDTNADGSGTAVYAKLFSSTMTSIGTEIQANSFTDNDQRDSTIAADANGNFIVSWSSDLQDGSGWGIYAQRFNFLGDKIGDEFLVNVFSNGDQRYGTVASDASGNFVIVWSSLNQVSATSSWDIFLRRYTQTKPTANDDTATTPKNTPRTINVLANDRPASGGTLDPTSVTVINNPVNGFVTVNPNGSITYTPITGFVGADTFTYVVADTDGTFSDPATVTITITGIGPVAVNDTATTNEDTAVLIPILANDTDSDGTINPASVSIKTPPAHGSVTVNPVTGVATYTPAPNYFGTDTFTYTVRDNDGIESNVATVTITIIAVIDAPVAVNDSAVTTRDLAVVINVLANDASPDSPIVPSTVTIVTPSANGTASVNPITGAVTFTPTAGFSGTATFTYTVANAAGLVSNVATVTVRVNAPPTAVNDTATTPEDTPVVINILANDTDPDGTIDPASVTIVSGPANGTLALNRVTGAVTYTPNANYFGSDSFTYTVKDNDGATSNVATVSITILAVNDPPVAVDDPTITDIGVPVVIDILANDYDVDGTIVPSSVTIVTGPTNGTVSINPVTGALTYTPNPGFVGGDLIIYTVQDNNGLTSNQAQVPIRVGLPSTIGGKVYLDLNNDGVQNGGEAGLGGVSLTLIKTDGPITFVLNTVTAADGSYSFADLIPGTYTLIQTQPGVFLDGKETASPGIPVDTIVNDQFIGIHLGSGVNANGFNFGERGIRAEFLSSYQGARIFLASASQAGGVDIFAAPAAGLNPSAGDIWIAIDGGWTGPLTFVATPGSGSASLTLYDNNLNPVAASTPVGGGSSFNYAGATGTSFFLRVSGSSSNVTVSAFDPTPAPVNAPPVLANIGNRTLEPGKTISFYVQATDPNPGSVLTYILAGNVPAGATINQYTGLFIWTAPADFSQPVTFTILVQDNGTTIKNDFETFTISPMTSNPGGVVAPADARAFVQSLYVDLLGRNADAGGLNAHAQRLINGATREELVATFTASNEYLGRVVDDLYSKYLLRGAETAGRNIWIASLANGMTQNEAASAFMSSVEYVSRFASNAAFVDSLYRNVLGRGSDAAGLNVHVASLQSGTSRTAMINLFLTSRERVDMVLTDQYGKFLERGVDGYGRQYYGDLLAGSMSAADDLADALLGSQEYLGKALRKFK